MRRSATCAVELAASGPHASVGVTRAHAQPIATRGHLPLDTFIRNRDF